MSSDPHTEAEWWRCLYGEGGKAVVLLHALRWLGLLTVLGEGVWVAGADARSCSCACACSCLSE